MLISGLKLGDLIKSKKGERITQGTVAELLGKQRPTINAWTKKAAVDVTEKEAEKLAKLLKVSLHDLTGNDTTTKSFKDEIFEGDYIGLHKRVWDQMEANMILHRELLRDLAKKLPQASNG